MEESYHSSPRARAAMEPLDINLGDDDDDYNNYNNNNILVGIPDRQPSSISSTCSLENNDANDNQEPDDDIELGIASSTLPENNNNNTEEEHHHRDNSGMDSVLHITNKLHGMFSVPEGDNSRNTSYNGQERQSLEQEEHGANTSINAYIHFNGNANDRDDEEENNNHEDDVSSKNNDKKSETSQSTHFTNNNIKWHYSTKRVGKSMKSMLLPTRFPPDQSDEELHASLAGLARCLQLLREYLANFGMPERGGPRDQEYVLREIIRDLYAGGVPLWALEPVMQKAAEGLTVSDRVPLSSHNGSSFFLNVWSLLCASGPAQC